MAASSDTFIADHWINQGKLFSQIDLPTHVQREWDRLLAIPSEYQVTISNCQLPVSDLLQCTSLPRLDDAAVQINPRKCFSNDPPLLPTPSQFRKRSIPPHQFLRSLLNVAGQAWLDGNQSVADWRFSNEKVPFWVLTYWINLARTVEARRDWVKADTFLKELTHGGASSSCREMASDFRNVFHSIGWGVPMRGAGEFLETQQLVALVTGKWLRNEFITAFISLINRRLKDIEVDCGNHVVVEDMEVINLLRKPTSDWNTYPSRRFRPLDRLGSDLASGQTRVLIFPVFVHENHWAVFSINSEEKTIRYGDSLESLPQPHDLVVIKRWLAYHGFDSLVEGEPLAHAHQTDAFSCGPIIANTIEHAVFGVPLWKPENRDVFRLELAMKLVDSHLDSSDSDHLSQAITDAHHVSESSVATATVPLPKALPSLAANVTPRGIPESSKKKIKLDLQSKPDKRDVPEPPTKKMKLDLRSKPDESGPLLNHFGRLSRQEWLDWEVKRDFRAREEAKLQREEDGSRKVQHAHDELIRKERVRKGNRDRKRLERARKKQLSVNDVLRDSPSAALDSIPMSVAEASRPKRGIIANIPTDAKGRGRKRKRGQFDAVRINWQLPLTWAMIIEARQITQGWSPREIMKQAKRISPAVFSRLTEQVVGRWIVRKGKGVTWPRWKDTVLERVKKGNEPGGQVTRTGVLADYPELVATIIQRFQDLRAAGIAISVVTARANTVALIEHKAPEVFATPAKDGSVFRCCESWMKKFLYAELRWVMRTSTRAAQKIPVNAEEQIRNSFFRHALTFRDANIKHPAFQVNMDQTQVVYNLGGGKTFDVQGAKQVAVVGEEEKRAFTLVVAVSGAGDLLPFQAIFGGKTKRSLPSDRAPRRDEAEELGFRFCFSNTDTYWSTFELMKEWVCDILVPYWMRKKEEFRVPSQECLLQIDVWSVHKSKEFRDWMEENWTWIIVEFVPGGTTSLFQPCDIGIQRPLKLSIKRSQHADIVQETLGQLKRGVPATEVRLDITVGTLRDRTVNWLVTAYNQVNKPEIVKKAFSGCKSGDFDLSFESITSPEALQALRDIQKNEPLVWEKIHLRADPPTDSELAGEPEPAFSDIPDDDSTITVDDVLRLADGRGVADHITQGDDGSLQPSGAAEDPFDDDAYSDDGGAEDDGPEEEIREYGRGKRRRVETKKYANDFWEH